MHIMRARCRWLAPVVAALALTLAGQAQAQPTGPLTCTSGQLYQLTTGNVATANTSVYAIPASYTQPSIPLFTVSGVSLNGLAYNPQDGYLYAVNNYTNAAGFRLYRLNGSGALANYVIGGNTTGIDTTRNSGTFDAHGNLFIADGAVAASQRIYLINGADGTAPTAQRIALAADPNPPAGYTGINQVNVGDLAYNHTESSATTAVLYGTRNVESASIRLYRIKIDLVVA